MQRIRRLRILEAIWKAGYEPSACSVSKMKMDYPQTAAKAVETVSRVLKQPRPSESELAETEKALTVIKHVLSDMKHKRCD